MTTLEGPQLDRVNAQIIIAPLPMRFADAEPVLNRLLLQLADLGAKVERANFRESMKAPSEIHLRVISKEGDEHELQEEVALGDHIMVYVTRGRLAAITLAPHHFAAALTQGPTMQINEALLAIGRDA